MNYQKYVIGWMIALNALVFVGDIDAAAKKRKYEAGDTWHQAIRYGATPEEREEFAAENPEWVQENIRAMREMQGDKKQKKGWKGYAVEGNREDEIQEKAEPLPLTSDDEDEPPVSSRPSRRKGR